MLTPYLAIAACSVPAFVERVNYEQSALIRNLGGSFESADDFFGRSVRQVKEVPHLRPRIIT